MSVFSEGLSKSAAIAQCTEARTHPKVTGVVYENVIVIVSKFKIVRMQNKTQGAFAVRTPFLTTRVFFQARSDINLCCTLLRVTKFYITYIIPPVTLFHL